MADALAAPGAEALDERDRGFLHELVLGTLRRRGWLDHALGGLSSRPIDRLTPGVLDALRLGAYQLLYLRVAEHAAVSESVELARAAEPRSAGFANAVLRRLQREGPPPAPDPIADPLGWLTSAGSLPRWLAERWCGQLGPEAAIARARSLLDAPPTYFRVNPRVSDAGRRLAAAGVEARETAIPGALERVEGRLSPLAAAGVVYVQDAGSQMVAHLAASRGLVLDACAAPGGKALLDGRPRRARDAGDRRRGVTAPARHPRPAALALGRGERLGPRRGRAAPALRGRLRLGAPRRALQRARHAGPQPRRPVAARARGRRAPRRAAKHPARERRRPWCARAVGWSMRPARSSPRRTRASWPRFSRRHPEFASEGLPSWAEPFRADGFVRIDPARHPVDAFFAARLRREG